MEFLLFLLIYLALRSLFSRPKGPRLPPNWVTRKFLNGMLDQDIKRAMGPLFSKVVKDHAQEMLEKRMAAAVDRHIDKEFERYVKEYLAAEEKRAKDLIEAQLPSTSRELVNRPWQNARS